MVSDYCRASQSVVLHQDRHTITAASYASRYGNARTTVSQGVGKRLLNNAEHSQRSVLGDVGERLSEFERNG